MQSIKIYGIKNCDTVKKALKYLDNKSMNYDFIDLKTASLKDKTIQKWLKHNLGKIINKRSTTYRQNKEQLEKILAKVDFEKDLITFVKNNPIIIKRPVIEMGDEIIIGFDENIYKELCNKSNK